MTGTVEPDATGSNAVMADAADEPGGSPPAAGSDGGGGAADDLSSRFQCPFCNSYDVSRLFVASLRMDSCECSACGARWDEVVGSGEYKGRATRSSVLLPRRRSG